MSRFTEWLESHKDWASMPIRLLLAFVFIQQGWGKITGLSGAAGFFESIGIPLAIVAATVVAVVELAGGIAVLLGWYTRYAASALAFVMVVAIIFVPSGYAQAGVALIASLSLMFSGAGHLSIDNRNV